MKDRRHTQRGECQVCGNIQAVDVRDNTLAVHGYTKRWGFFEGTCSGSDHKPLELDKTLVVEAIARVNADLDLRRPHRDQISKRESGKMMVRQYEESKVKGYGKIEVWREYEIRDDNREEWKRNYSTVHLLPLERAFAELKEDYLERLDKEISDRESYVAWQTQRLKIWQVRPLLEVEKIERAKREEQEIKRAERKALREAREAQKLANKRSKPENIEQVRQDALAFIARGLKTHHGGLNDAYRDVLCTLDSQYNADNYLRLSTVDELEPWLNANQYGGKLTCLCWGCHQTFKKCTCK